MRILKLDIEGFRSFKSQSWQPGDLNVLIGPNASGKSNLLRVLELLTAAAAGRLGEFILRREGGMESLVWDGQVDGVRVRAKMSPLPPYSDNVTDALTYDLELTRLGSSSSYRIESEVLGNFYKVEAGETLEPFKLLERDPRHAVVYSMNAKRFESIPTTTRTTTTTTPYPGNSSPIEVSDDKFLPEDETLLSFSSGPFAANRFAAGFQQELANWMIYQAFRSDRDAPIRSSQITRAETQLEPDGQNLIAVLHSLYTGSRDFKNDVNSAMTAAFGDDFEELVFPPAADQRIQLRLRWRSLKREQSAADLSDGTLRFLFLLAVLANPKPPPLLAIDEPETGLHPSMLPIVAEYARDASSRSQVIFTTHSAEFLDAFGDEPPTTTIVERQNGETQLNVVSGESLSYWLKQYTLGELFRSRELEALR